MEQIIVPDIELYTWEIINGSLILTPKIDIILKRNTGSYEAIENALKKSYTHSKIHKLQIKLNTTQYYATYGNIIKIP